MPYPKSSEGYSVELANALEEAAQNQIVIVPCGTRREAFALRTRFYFYFRALRKDAEKPQSWMAEGDFERVRDLAKKSYSVMILIDEENNRMILKSRDLDPGIKALTNREVTQPGVGIQPTTIDESLERLKNRIRSK